uniref:Uncharacterized protein n=1 Tax=Anguilla anguilla TaxID=7936 RepID=A0A0E9SPB0_ANGAN
MGWCTKALLLNSWAWPPYMIRDFFRWQGSASSTCVNYTQDYYIIVGKTKNCGNRKREKG